MSITVQGYAPDVLTPANQRYLPNMWAYLPYIADQCYVNFASYKTQPGSQGNPPSQQLPQGASYPDSNNQALFFVEMQDMGGTGFIPFLATQWGLWVERDIQTYGALMTTSDPYKSVSPGAGGGAILIGHGLYLTTTPPLISLTDSDVWVDQNNHALGKFDTLHLFMADGSTPAHLDLGNLAVHGGLTVEGDAVMGNVSVQNGSSVAPVNDNNSFIGTSTKMWQNIWTRNLQVGVVGSNYVTFSVDSTGLVVGFDTSSSTGGIIPQFGVQNPTKTFALGSSTNRWHDIYGTNVNAYNLTLNGTTAQLNLNGDVGTSGKVLTSAGAGATPTWTTPSQWNGGTVTGKVTISHAGDAGGQLVIQNSGTGGNTVSMGIGDSGLFTNQFWLGNLYGTNGINDFAYGIKIGLYGQTSYLLQAIWANSSKLTLDTSGNLTAAGTLICGITSAGSGQLSIPDQYSSGHAMYLYNYQDALNIYNWNGSSSLFCASFTSGNLTIAGYLLLGSTNLFCAGTHLLKTDYDMMVGGTLTSYGNLIASGLISLGSRNYIQWGNDTYLSNTAGNVLQVNNGAGGLGVMDIGGLYVTWIVGTNAGDYSGNSAFYLLSDMIVGGYFSGANHARNIYPYAGNTGNCGTSTYYWGSMWSHYIFPPSNNSGTVGGDGSSGTPYWNTMYSYYFRYKSAPSSFDALDDLDIVRKMKTKTVAGKDVIDESTLAHLIDDKGFYEVGKVNGWNLSLQRKFVQKHDEQDDRMDALLSRIEAIENQLRAAQKQD